MKNLLLLFCLLLSPYFSHAQKLTQTLRGTVVDKVTQMPLPGATVLILNEEPLIGTTTSLDGEFRLSQVPIGSKTLKVSYIGYKDAFLPNMVVNSGKELVLVINLEEDITAIEEVVVTAEVEKSRALNEMAPVSARTFSVEETRKYAAAINDPARMVTAFAGVVSTGDGANGISIRGNAPRGLLWRMEGVDIPNPNHFANLGSAGGGISILSAQLLSNSDFMTGAFPAEYGNALSGVFDLKLRKGNNETHEYTFQAGFLGIDGAVEGPFRKGYGGSYLINYRYSTLSMLSQLGLIDLGDFNTTFQDLSYHLTFPTKKAGQISVFGFSGLSSEIGEADRDTTLWEFDYQRYDSRFYANTHLSGLKHSIVLNSKNYLQSALVFSQLQNGYIADSLSTTFQPYRQFNERFIDQSVLLSSVLNTKISPRLHGRSGIYLKRIGYDFLQRYPSPETNEMQTYIQSEGTMYTVQLFSQWNYAFSETWQANVGMHYIRLTLNGTQSIEPRASIKHAINTKQSISLGYGLHGQTQNAGIYFTEQTESDGSKTLINKSLGMSKAHHWVLSYDHSLSPYLRLKTEAYYQYLYSLPVSPDVSNPLASINFEEGLITEKLVNKGRGRNYGLELTLEQFTYNNTYFLLSGSLFNSEYQALDKVWRNTRYNSQYAFSFTGGKEFFSTKKEKNITYGINMKVLYTGGFRYTPIDIEASREQQQIEYITEQTFSLQNKDYFRTDLRLSMKINKKRTTSTLALDIQNLTNRKNIQGTYFDLESEEMVESYQLPLIPILSYRIEF
ncbi:TonB-dependent receptor [Cytophagales bacterium LB-30]|uniref:TonB-dependent receptor n=1 Tax=Shiella aurantiaca TaxID=3058365 RepID=A0ABT8F2C6_9BACT|nr:TonB-dependent receptor [Shiella aurantiaca]MDN4164196.1 TonB-dependent receptor [Shiella aurantiaca]